MKKILIVVDMQNDFIDGSLGTSEAVKIVPNVINKVEQYSQNEHIIYYTKDTHFDDYLSTPEGKNLPVKHCIKNTNGWNIPDHIYKNGCKIVEKYTFGSVDLFNELNELKDDIESIELIGLCTDICVISNAMLAKAYFPNIRIIIDSACCAGVTIESHNKALDVMRMCQIEVK